MIGLAAQALGVFGESIRVFEETSARNKGRVTQTIGPDRTIFGVIQPLNQQEQMIQAAGSRAKGDLILQTKHQLYYRDVTDSGRVTQQSYVYHLDQKWRVVDVSDYSNHTGARRYILAKYVNG